MRALLLFSAISPLLMAADWPQFRGSDGQGIATESKPPLEWSDTKNVRWKVELPGPGASSPIQHGGKVFATCYSGYGLDLNSPGNIRELKRHLICLNAADGKVLWERSVAADASEDEYNDRLSEHGYATQTPATDGERVYAFFGKSGVLAFDMNGKQLWQADAGKGSSGRGWGSATSVVLYKDLVIVNAADESSAILAFDKATGKPRWKTDGGAYLEKVYNTPVVVGDERVDIVVAVQNEVWGLNPDTGKLRWHAAVPISSNMAAGVVAHEGVVYAFGGNRGPGTVAVKAGGSGDVTKSHVLWTSTRGTDFPTPVIHEGHLYFANSQGVAYCMSAKDGEIVYQERIEAGRGRKGIYASPVMADGKIYLVTRTAGIAVIAAKPKFEQLAHNVMATDTATFNATPSIAGDTLLLRSNSAIYCIGK
jgi:hypothetical protein